ncbi:MAG: hypothetical protein OEY24_01085 [Candidatus Bathyarchaeota archaeon]|nr:hypothetical protein [Candidatus Bathyarchaeota archaeon]MDH5494287.1 hypothetical protein [Candidatus Bathyarchaeota archaeon]
MKFMRARKNETALSLTTDMRRIPYPTTFKFALSYIPFNILIPCGV